MAKLLQMNASQRRVHNLHKLLNTATVHKIDACTFEYKYLTASNKN